MYPFITLRWQHIEMTGLWFIIGIIIVCLICRYHAPKLGIVFSDLLYFLPNFMIIVYFCGAYIWFVLRTQHLFPYSMREVSQIIIPPNFWFHASGLVIWFVIALLVFLYKLRPTISKKARIDCLALGISGALSVVWMFLILGDQMIWLPTSSQIGIHALTPLSAISKFKAVLPVWLFITIASLVVYSISIFVLKHQIPSGRGMGSFWFLFLFIAIILLFQNYSRHGVIRIGSIHVDINQYVYLTMSTIFFIWYYYNYIKYHHLRSSKK